jgi:general secretion pathway protein G
MTLIEIMLATALVGVLMAIAIPSYRGHVLRVKIQQARSDLSIIQVGVLDSRGPDHYLPDTLAQVHGVPQMDPWGHPYVYYYFGRPGTNMGPVRKDRNLVPINSEFDLYSMGPDGQSRPQLTAPTSLDDVIVGRDGDFIGTAADF